MDITKDFINYNKQTNFKDVPNYIRHGCLDLIEVLLDHGLDVNYKDKQSLVYHSLDSGQFSMFNLLVKHNVNLNEPMLLLIASYHGWLEIVELLLKFNDVNFKGRYGYYHGTSLLIAVSKNHTNIVKLLLQADADPNIKCQYGRTPLFVVKSIEMADLLVKNKADLYIRDERGNCCIIDFHFDLLEFFISDIKLLNSVDSDGDSLLHRAIINRCYIDNTKEIILLLNAGIDLSLTNRKGQTAYEYALYEDQKEIAKLIKEYEEIPIKEPVSV